MFKNHHFKLTSLLIICYLLSTSLSAEQSYIGFGTGLQLNLGTLGETIASGGLDSAQKSRTIAKAGLCDHQTASTPVTDPCAASSLSQELIVPENKLIALEKSTAMAIRAHTSGAMTGLVLEMFLEKQYDATFIRVGVQHVRRLYGGRTRSTMFEGSPIELEWLKHEFSYKAWHIPFYYGINLPISESGSVYAGAGLNYSYGGWGLGGTILGDVPANLLGIIVGPHNSLDPTKGTVAGQNIYKEAAQFRVKGFGFNFLIGADKQLANGNKIFFELETIVAGKYGVAVTASAGGRAGLGGVTSYPINLSGTRYKFGYKLNI